MQWHAQFHITFGYTPYITKDHVKFCKQAAHPLLNPAENYFGKMKKVLSQERVHVIVGQNLKFAQTIKEISQNDLISFWRRAYLNARIIDANAPRTFFLLDGLQVTIRALCITTLVA
jgi:hypothetical protein